MNNAAIEVVNHFNNKMSPDPRNNEISLPVSGSDVPPINFLQLEDSDSDASPEDDGYELLNANELESYEDDEPVHNHLNLSHLNGMDVFEPPIMKREESDEEMLEEASSSIGKRNSHQLTPEQAETIKSAMKEIKLPESAVPSWASLVPEERWKSMLDSKLKGKSNSPTDDI